MTLFRNILLSGLLAVVQGSSSCLQIPEWQDPPRDAGNDRDARGTKDSSDINLGYDAEKSNDVYDAARANDAKFEDVRFFIDVHDSGVATDVARLPDATPLFDARTLEDVVTDSRISLPDSQGADAYDAGAPDTGTPDVRVVPDCVITGNHEPFYTGPIETAGVGECKIGERVCIDNNGRAMYATVTPEVTPQPERCDEKDNNCDGATDDGYDVGMRCEIGVGACHSEGTKECTPNGLETRCNARVIEPQEEVCGNNVDDDCDGVADNNWILCDTLIAYIHRIGEEQYDVYLTNIDGTESINLTNHEGNDWNGEFIRFKLPISWVPNGRSFAFVSNEGIKIYGILTRQERLIGLTAGFYGVTFSPSGNSLTYMHNGFVGIINVASGEIEQMAQGVTPAWFPDEESIVYGQSGVNCLIRHYKNGEIHNLFGDRINYSCAMPSISTNQRRILFVNCLEDGCVQYLNMDDGGIVRGRGGGLWPKWLTNQTYIDIMNSGVYLNEIGGGVRNLTDNAQLDSTSPPTVSPDGRYVVFVTDRHGTKDLYKVEVATGIETRLTDDPGDEEAPVFAPVQR